MTYCLITYKNGHKVLASFELDTLEHSIEHFKHIFQAFDTIKSLTPDEYAALKAENESTD